MALLFQSVKRKGWIRWTLWPFSTPTLPRAAQQATCFPSSASRVFSASTQGGNQHSPLPCRCQVWRTWRGLGEHLPDFHGQECFAHTPISRSFANLRVVMWFAFSPHHCLRCSRCCFQNLFLLLFLAQGCQPLTCSLPAILHWSATL